MRLWRRLGWHVYDLDDAITVLQNAAPAGLARLNDQLLRQCAVVATLAKRYSLAVCEALALFVTTPTFATIPTRTVPTLPGDELRDSLYHDLFENRTVLALNVDPTKIDYFELNDAGTEIKHIDPNPLLADNVSRLVAGLQVTDSDVNLAITTFTDGNLTLANLSAIYRNVKLASILGVTLTELVKLLAIAEAATPSAPGYEQVNPFDGSRPESSLAFARIVEAIRDGGLSIDQLDYIVRGVSNEQSAVAPDPVAVGMLLLNLRNGLLKIASETKPSADPTGAATRNELSKLTLLSATDIATTMAILDGTSALTDPARDAFVASTLGPYMDDVADARAKLVGAAALAPGGQRFEYVLANVLFYQRRARGTALVVQSLAQSLGIATATAALLVNDWFPSASAGAHAIADFLALPDIPLSDTNHPISPNGGFAQYFATYAALAKTALIISSLNLSSDEVAWWMDSGVPLGWLDPTTLPASTTATAQGRFHGSTRLLTARRVRDGVGVPVSSWRKLFDLAKAAPDNDKANYQRQLAALTQWPADVLKTLCGDPANLSDTGSLSLTYPDDYRSEVALERLVPAIRTITRAGIPANVGAWIASTVTADAADAIKQAVKARYPTEQWLALAKQLRDPLRESQRDALVAYLLVAPPPTDVTRWLDSDDVFGHFLIDVEMGACQATSRIVQATATVQLFVQRCFLDLESSAVQIDVNRDGDWWQWQWMSQYRLWQANREVFLFPENWIDPTLRSNKSPFFADLEQELKQGDVTSEAVEVALANYLEKLESVARLDVCGTFHDTENGQDILHVLARTQGSPPIYYTRKWMNSSVWTAWEKVELDITSDHVLPLVWNGKQYLFWAVVNRKPDEAQTVPPVTGLPSPTTPFTPGETKHHLEVQLAWSQFKQHKWQPKQTARQTIVLQGYSDPAELTLMSSQLDSALRIDVNIEIVLTGERLRGLGGVYTIGGAADGVQAFIVQGVSNLGQVGGQGVAEVGTWTGGQAAFGPPAGAQYDGDWIAPDAISQKFLSPARQRVSVLWAPAPSSRLILQQADYFRLVTPHRSTNGYDPFFYRDAAREYFVIPQWTTGIAQPFHVFVPFYHPFASLLVRELNRSGVDALFARRLQVDPALKSGASDFDFVAYYGPQDVLAPYPQERMDFDADAGYSIYNWELFFHAPLLIGSLLTAHQRFDIARRWYEYVFNPGGPVSDAVSEPLPNSSTGLTSWYVGQHNIQHVAYIGVDGAVYDLFDANDVGAWLNRPISDAAGAPHAATTTGLASWVTAWDDDTQHVVYIGVDGVVYELFDVLGGAGVWTKNAISDAAGAPHAAATTGLTSWVTTTPDIEQLVAYIGVDGVVYALSHQLGGADPWKTIPISNAAGAPHAAAATGLTSWFSPDGLQHVVYIGVDGVVCELFARGGPGTWTKNPISDVAGAPHAAITGLTSWVTQTSSDSAQHVAYIGVDGVVYELFYVLGGPGTWTKNPIGDVAGAPHAATTPGLTSWFAAPNMTQHVVYIGVDGVVYELFGTAGSGSPWAKRAISDAARAPRPSAGTQLTSWFTDADATSHVAYLGNDSVLYELYDTNTRGVWLARALNTAAGVPQRFWITKPLFELQAPDYVTQQIANLMQAVNAQDTAAEKQVVAWRKDPFDPDKIAQLRPVAYARAIVMKYIDNLISWGDQLFARDTMESINLATQLYVLAAELLGPRPDVVPPRVRPPAKTYDELVQGKLDDFSNELVAAENAIGPVSVIVPSTNRTQTLPTLNTLYFRIPPNTQLLTYWDTVADRLFKIRHCMNIEGTVQPLPLFAPPISPGLLVAAAAAGLDLASVLSDTGAALPPYRFRTMIRHAIELCEVVRGLGVELLAALEKSDAEALARIRSGAEKQVQAAILDVRTREIDAASQAIEALTASKQTFIDRANFYANRSLMNDWETASLVARGLSLVPQTMAGFHEVGATIAHLLPTFDFGLTGAGGSPTAKAQWGGANLAGGLGSAAGALHTFAAVIQTGAELASVLGQHHQRKDSWDLEGTVAKDEMVRIDAELLGAQIRLDVAQKQQAAQDVSVNEASEVDDFLHSKSTDQELYDWMIGQTSTTYFQAYQLAYSTAKQAEQCLRRELATSDTSYIQFGYWDSLRKGLAAGDKLLFDLRRLESAYYTQNARELEISKHVSLLQLDPYAVVELRNTGTCIVDLPEMLFDLDNPGHYLRRLKNVAVTVPCVVGPYGSVAMTLTLLGSRIQTSSNSQNLDYLDDAGGTSQIVTSHAQNDAGIFELRFETSATSRSRDQAPSRPGGSPQQRLPPV